MNNHLTAQQVAEQFGVDRTAVGRWIRSGLLTATRINSRLYLIDKKDLDGFMPPPRGNPGFIQGKPQPRKIRRKKKNNA